MVKRLSCITLQAYDRASYGLDFFVKKNYLGPSMRVSQAQILFLIRQGLEVFVESEDGSYTEDMTHILLLALAFKDKFSIGAIKKERALNVLASYISEDDCYSMIRAADYNTFMQRKNLNEKSA